MSDDSILDLCRSSDEQKENTNKNKNKDKDIQMSLSIATCQLDTMPRKLFCSVLGFLCSPSQIYFGKLALMLSSKKLAKICSSIAPLCCILDVIISSDLHTQNHMHSECKLEWDWMNISYHSYHCDKYRFLSHFMTLYKYKTCAYSVANNFLQNNFKLERLMKHNLGEQLIWDSEQHMFRVVFEGMGCRLLNYNTTPMYSPGLGSTYSPGLGNSAFLCLIYCGESIKTIVGSAVDDAVKYLGVTQAGFVPICDIGIDERNGWSSLVIQGAILNDNQVLERVKEFEIITEQCFLAGPGNTTVFDFLDSYFNIAIFAVILGGKYFKLEKNQRAKPMHYTSITKEHWIFLNGFPPTPVPCMHVSFCPTVGFERNRVCHCKLKDTIVIPDWVVYLVTDGLLQQTYWKDVRDLLFIRIFALRLSPHEELYCIFAEIIFTSVQITNAYGNDPMPCIMFVGLQTKTYDNIKAIDIHQADSIKESVLFETDMGFKVRVLYQIEPGNIHIKPLQTLIDIKHVLQKFYASTF